MNKAALKKHEIYNKLAELNKEGELTNIADYIDFMRYKQQHEEKKMNLNLCKRVKLVFTSAGLPFMAMHT